MLTVLWSGVDTLEASFRGALEEPTVARLQELKKQAQEENLGQPLTVGPLELLVHPAGVKPWSYLLSTEDLHLRLSAAKTIPTVSAKLLALGLMAYGHEELYRLAAHLASELGATPAGLSRLDVAVDFQGHTPTYEEMRQVVCGSGFRPIYPNTETPETFQFGRDQIVVRLYDKTKELAKSGKTWLPVVWGQHPAYNPEQAVWRFEAQYRRQVLREFLCGTAEQAFAHLDRLLGVALVWCSPRQPVEENLSRCPILPWWEELKAASFAGEPLPRIKEENRVGSFRSLVPQVLGLIVSGAAHLRVSDLDQALELQKEEMERYLRETGTTFADRVEERTRRIRN